MKESKRVPKVPTFRLRIAVVLAQFALVPTVCLCLLLLFIADAWYRSDVVKNTEKVAVQMGLRIDGIMRLAENTAFLLAKDSLLQSARDDFASGTTLEKELDYYMQIKKLLLFVNSYNEFYNIRVFLPDARIATREGVSLFGLDSMDRSKLPPDMRDRDERTGWSGVHESVSYDSQSFMKSEQIVTFYHILFSSSSVLGARGTGVIAIDISTETVRKLLNSYAKLGGVSYIMVVDGKAIAPLSSIDPDGDAAGREVLRLLGEQGADGGGRTGRNGYFCSFLPLEAKNWTMAAYVPLRRQTGMNGIMIVVTVVVILFCIGAIPLVSSYTAGGMTREVRELSSHMMDANRGIRHEVAVNATTREVRMLQECHNGMVKTVDALIRDIYEEQRAKQEAQMVSLFEQVKPHFLYNTLESAKWLAVREKAAVTTGFLENVAKYFKLSLSKGKDWIPLEQELDHIRAYLDIMNTRMENRIEYDIRTDGRVGKMTVLKLLLQPLVENAIVHGICEKDDPRGRIRIAAEHADGEVQIMVSDDGIGIDPGQLDRINGNGAEGYGIRNVLQRMRLYYKQPCRFRMENNPEGGSSASLRLPSVD